MAEPEKKYEIIETKYEPKRKTKLDFLGSLEKAKALADKKARENIGVRYAVFPEGGLLAEFQAYYRTTITCPKCGTVIPLE